MADNINVKLKLDGERDFTSALKMVNNELKNMTSAIKAADAETRGNANSYENLKNKVELLGNAYRAAENKVKTLTDIVNKEKETQKKAAEELAKAKKLHGENSAEVDKAQQAYNKATDKVNKWETELNKATAEQNRLNGELKKNEGYLDEAAKSADGTAQSIDELGKETGDFQKTVGNLAALETFKRGLEAVSQITQLFGDALDDTAEKAEAFQSSMAKVSTLTDSTVDMTAMSGEIRKLSREYGISADEIAEATYQAISASVDTASAVDFVSKATKLSIGGFTDSSKAVDVLTTALNAYKMDVSEVERLSDNLITTQRLGKTTVDELASSIGQVIPVAAAYGVGINDISASYVTLTRGGINTANATTYVRAMLSELGKQSSTVAKTLKDKTGKTFAELTGEGANLGDVLDILSDSVHNDTTAFANLWGNVRAGMGALAIVNAGTDEYRVVLDELANSTGAADEAYQKMADTAEMSGARLETSMQNFQIALGESMEPAIRAGQEVLTGFFDKATEVFESLPEPMQNVIGTIAAVGQAASNVVPQILNFVTQLATLRAMEAVSGKTSLLSNMLDKLKGSFSGAGNSASSLGSTLGTAAIVVAGVAAGMAAVNAAAENLAKTEVELKNRTDELESSYSGYVDEIDVLKRTLNTYGSTAEKRAAIEELQAKITQANTEATARQGQAVDGLTDAQSYNMQVGQENLSVWEQMLDGLTNGAVTLMGTSKRFDSLGEVVKDSTTIIDGSSEALGELDAMLAEVNAEEQALATSVTNASGEIVAAKDASISKLGEELAAWNNLDAATQQTASAVAQACGAMLDSITGSIQSQISWFDELAEREKLSADTLAKNLQDQINSIKEWESNLTFLANQGINENLLQYLADMGPQGAAYVQAFVDAANGETAVGIQEMNDLWMQKLDLESGINEEANGLLTAVGEMAAGSKEAFAAMAEELNAATNENGKYIVAGLVQGIRTAEAEAKTAGQTLGTDTVEAVAAGAETQSPSRATMETGQNIAQGLVQGMSLRSSAVQAQAKKMAQQVVNALKTANIINTARAEGQKVGTGLVNGMTSQRASVAAAATSLASVINSAVRSQSGAAYSAGASLAANLASGINANAGAPISAIQSIMNRVAATARSSDTSGAYAAGRAIAQGMQQGILAGQSLAINAAAQMAAQAVLAAKKQLGIKSPSKVFEEQVGKMAALGLEEGFNAQLNLGAADMASQVQTMLRMPDMSVYSGNQVNNVYVYVGDKELSAVLSSSVIKNVSNGVRRYGASMGAR